MLARIGARWWLILVCAFPAAFAGVFLAAFTSYNTEPLYIGRTVLAESLGPPVPGQPAYYNMRLGNLGNLASSQAVLSNAAQTLNDLGLKFTPEQILSSTSIMPVKDTSFLAIEVTLPDPREAKVAADVIAAELKKEYLRRNALKSGEMGLKTIDPVYVRPVDQHKALKLGLGLIGGFLLGAVLGLILAAALPCRARSHGFSPEQGV